jgi:hypothetical protein
VRRECLPSIELMRPRFKQVVCPEKYRTKVPKTMCQRSCWLWISDEKCEAGSGPSKSQGIVLDLIIRGWDERLLNSDSVYNNMTPKRPKSKVREAGFALLIWVADVYS